MRPGEEEEIHLEITNDDFLVPILNRYPQFIPISQQLIPSILS